jgi:hypothetical protein
MLFEIWVYRGVIATLLIIVWWIIQKYVSRQEDYNTRIFQLLDKNEQAITRLNILLDANEKLCDTKMGEHKRRLDDLEMKNRIKNRAI